MPTRRLLPLRRRDPKQRVVPLTRAEFARTCPESQLVRSV